MRSGRPSPTACALTTCCAVENGSSTTSGPSITGSFDWTRQGRDATDLDGLGPRVPSGEARGPRLRRDECLRARAGTRPRHAWHRGGRLHALAGKGRPPDPAAGAERAGDPCPLGPDWVLAEDGRLRAPR